ncbi:hypothetical protein OESDEN_13308 [Oesophagostomum dentatum]|uniref:Uncharacterized protein n=1 Tax=Oesophagostomum dentatum TaxID=61180 RepID=A0A0B1SNL1_OESDE|nr:hypothetical protein OESDEN_13308 [Oesophagostomum dentatum]
MSSPPSSVPRLSDGYLGRSPSSYSKTSNPRCLFDTKPLKRDNRTDCFL